MADLISPGQLLSDLIDLLCVLERAYGKYAPSAASLAASSILSR